MGSPSRFSHRRTVVTSRPREEAISFQDSRRRPRASAPMLGLDVTWKDMGLRAPASWKDYHTCFALGQRPHEAKKRVSAPLCPSLPLLARCAEAWLRGFLRIC